MKITKEQFLNLQPCREGIEFAEKRGFDPEVCWNTCERGDWLIWLLRNTNSITKAQAVEMAISFALHVIDTFESKYPDDKRPRKAIEAAQAWLKEPSAEHEAEASAAYEASAAAYAAYATTYAAAYATYAAAAAATCATYAATCAAYAAYAAAAAKNSESKWQAGKIREIVPCPFTK